MAAVVDDDVERVIFLAHAREERRVVLRAAPDFDARPEVEPFLGNIDGGDLPCGK